MMCSKYVRVVTLLRSRYSVGHLSLYTHHISRTTIPHASCIPNTKINSFLFFKSEKYISSEKEQFSRDQGHNPGKFSWNKGVKHIISGVVVCLFCDYILSDRDEHLQFMSPLTVDPPIPYIGVFGINIFPAVKKIFHLMPDNMRQKIIIKMGAPDLSSPVLDPYDCNQQNPYQIEEVLENKVWRIGYNLEQFIHTRPKNREDFKLLGMDPTSQEFERKVLISANGYGNEAFNAVKKDLKSIRTLYEKNSFSKEELFASVPPWKLNMMVVKLNSGGILLYAPVKIHKDAKELLYAWLESLGRVEWIVAASSAHTLCFPDVLEAFPEAKVVGPKVAEEKLKYINVIKQFEYLTTDENDMKKLNDALETEGVQLFNIEGDVAANAVICLVQNEVLLECDLVYGHHDGHGLLDVDKSTLLQWKPEDYLMRLFKFGLISKPNSPNGFLPIYRFWLMDPNSLGAMLYNPPEKDGSSRHLMAESLRKVLGFKYNTAVGVHFDRMNREDFSGSIDAAWNWLDGNSLK